MPEPVTLNQAFVEAASVLRQAGIDTPELDARLLLCHAAGLSHEAYIAGAGDALPPATLARFGTAIDAAAQARAGGAHHRHPRVLWPWLPARSAWRSTRAPIPRP